MAKLKNAYNRSLVTFNINNFEFPKYWSFQILTATSFKFFPESKKIHAFWCAWSSERSNEQYKKKSNYFCAEFFQKVKTLNFVERKFDFFSQGANY